MPLVLFEYQRPIWQGNSPDRNCQREISVLPKEADRGRLFLTPVTLMIKASPGLIFFGEISAWTGFAEEYAGKIKKNSSHKNEK